MSAAKRRSSPRTPRASFVVTISMAAAAIAGCGGQVDGSGDPITDQSHNPPMDTGPLDAPSDVATTCPTFQPRSGAACSGTLFCDYGSCSPTGSTGGKAFQCVDGRFQESVSTCNPPPACPTDEPLAGTPCATSGFGGCSYPDRCADRPADAPADEMLYCSGKWTLGGAAYVARCPAVAPANGTSCRCGNHYYGTCSFGSCSMTSGPIVATCDSTTGLWRTSTVTCNPPDAGGLETGPAEAGFFDAGAAP